MSTVSGAACRPIVMELQQRGFAPEMLIEGLPYEPADLQKPNFSMDWESFTILLERAAKLLGGPHAIEDLAFRNTSRSLPKMIQRIVPRLASPRPLYMMGARWLGPWFFQTTRATCEELADGRLREVITILPPHRPCEEFLEGQVGIMRAGPTLLGLPEAVVELSHDGQCGEYVITLPPRPRSLWRRRSHSFAAMPGELAELGFQQEQLRDSLRRTQRANEALARTTERLETLNLLAREVTQTTELDPMGTHILGLLSASLNVNGVRLLVRSPESDELEELLCAGNMAGGTRSFSLRTQELEIGVLELSGGPEGNDAGQEALLASLLPWLSIAVANARAFDLLSRQSNRLQEEISERRRTQDELEQTQRLDALGRLAGGLAHDMNNLITGVMGYASLATDLLEEEHPVRSDLDEIRLSCERAAGLLSQVLEFSRKQVAVPSVVDLNGLVQGVAPLLGRLIGAQIELELRCTAEACPVFLDARQLEQGLVNLVTNARDAISGDGRIIIETRFSEAGCELIVRDDGRGIDPAIRMKIFEPFFTTKKSGEGTGIGLSSVAHTVEVSGGRIQTDSGLGQGTTFTLWFPPAPVVPEKAQTATRPPPRPAPSSEHGTILLVEDDDSVRRMARRILEGQGYIVIEAQHGLDALDLCQARREPVDLLLTDIVMPRMDGRELAHRVLALRPELRGVVAMTGYAEAAGGDGLDLPGHAQLLRKPFGANELLEAVSSCLGSTVQKTV